VESSTVTASAEFSAAKISGVSVLTLDWSCARAMGRLHSNPMINAKTNQFIRFIFWSPFTVGDSVLYLATSFKQKISTGRRNDSLSYSWRLFACSCVVVRAIL
jgi:hypothetical protein